MILALLAAAAGPVQVAPLPAAPYAEVTGEGVEIDGDFILVNHGDEPLGIDELAVEVRTDAGELVQRREWNSNGTSPSIRMLNTLEVPANGQVLLFNPISRFAAGIDVARLEVIVALSRKGVDERIEARTQFTPKREAERRFAFPMNGRVLVWEGHDFASHHRRWDLGHPALKAAGYRTNAARYSLDLIAVDAQGKRSNGDEAVNENWFAFGAPVLAEASGKVVEVSDAAPDDRRFDPAQIAVPNALYGNRVVLAHDDGSYSIYGHLRQGSARVQVGDTVATRQPIAEVGASGSALFPHLHVQRMDGPTDRSEGVPTRFEGLTRPGGAEVAAGFVDSGDVIIAD